jgi:type III restriction enzyme
MISLMNYQEKAIEELSKKLKRLLEYEGQYVVSFKAPTGSGKTLMVSETIIRIINDIEVRQDLSFVWISVRSLHEQSKEKLEEYLNNNKLLTCSYFNDLQERQISKNEILFINWESINKKDINILVRENEQDNNLNSVIARTKAEKRKIILIIDESHHTANAERSRELISVIAPDLTLEVSATPVQKIFNEYVEVKLSDVKAEQMIKSEIAVNPGFMDLKVGAESSDELIIDQALQTRKMLLNAFKSEGSNINPLVLIQLPDKKSDLDEKKEDVIKLLDRRFEVSESNGRLAIWLAEDKSPSLNEIEKPDNDVEVLIFKQAIALGWDCPRAYILVIFRELRSFTFTIQTVGRIMRMPEFKYYKHDVLNKAYVFTNLSNVIIEGDEFKDYISTNESKRANSRYQNICLRSASFERMRERTRLSGEFLKIFQKVVVSLDLKKRINLSPTKITDFVIADGKIRNVDQIGEIESRGTIPIASTPEEINRKFDLFVWRSCTPYAPADSSDRIKSSIYSFMKDNFGVDKYSEQAQIITLGSDNIALFEEAIFRSKEVYETEVVKKLNRERKISVNSAWEIPEFVFYNEKYIVFSSRKSIMQPFYRYIEASKTEIEFMKFLDRKDNTILWWFKNRENEPKYFAVKYENEEGDKSAFYVDFIVKFIDGSIGLYDTKYGGTATIEHAKAKAEALQAYIKMENRNGKNIKGGIVIPSDTKYSSWRINQNDTYTDDFKNIGNWKPFNL